MSSKKGFILTINSGSSSLKFSVYRNNEIILRGQFDRVKTIDCTKKVIDFRGNILASGTLVEGIVASHSLCLKWLISFLALEHIRVEAVGHRVVHGGLKYLEPVLLDPKTIDELEQLCDLAPLHQPHNMDGIRACASHLPGTPQVACFDTAFHRHRPMSSRLYGIPKSFAEKGILAYGFHGLSYEHITQRIPEVSAPFVHRKIVVCHLGNGSSVCGIVDGKGIMSSMGFTALDGLLMGTRCGQIDPGIVLHLIKHEKMGVDEVENLLYKESGLLGLSGVSSDVRDLEQVANDGNRDAQMALEVFSKRVAEQVMRMTQVMQGLDAVIFTAGIGENSSRIRNLICNELSWFGLLVDPKENARNAPRISSESSRIAAYVIPTDEEGVIARHTTNIAFR